MLAVGFSLFYLKEALVVLAFHMKEAFLSIALNLLIAWFGSAMCGNTVVTSISSPSQQYQAVLFERNCGATSGFSTQISILRKGETLSGSGNIFVADDNHREAKAAGWGGPYAETEWIANDVLLVQYDAKAYVFVMEQAHAGVTIKFQPLER